jgi:hypothetical protein
MEKVTVRPIMHPGRPIEVSPAEAEVLRARGLLADDEPPAPTTPTTPTTPTKTTAAGGKAKANTEGNTPS